ncbi:MAG TPA: GH1 family beta-glucosidase [Ferruginibacter sp.]|nr:GH1 family beta-glucosidase [Ferruginibacter sp.]HRO17759.1 GH1 family beta-glucosidase [Ferruginibacter sp.]HRQ21654.1 GH1 family beta-glucosidase [Ferruginibacter sp.]
MNRYDEVDFAWGVSTAAYQTEGAYVKDGKGLSIWDAFTGTRGKIRSGQHARVACDFYHRYAQDISILKVLGIPHFRFSISWSRILPEGTGTVNWKGIAFYHKVIDYCLELGITPWITLYHWDLPLALEKKGGWANRDIIHWFEEYVTLCMRTYGSKVKHWIVMNEPMAFTGAGYFLGLHAPGKRGLKYFLPAMHHAALSQAAGIRCIQSFWSDAHLGTTFSASWVEPHTDRDKDIQAAMRVDALLNRAFIEPLMGLGYPLGTLPFLQRLETYVKDGDETALAAPVDFVGLQIYTRELVRYNWLTPFIQASLVPAPKRNVPLTSMQWEVYPQSIYKMLHQFNRYVGVRSIIVTENGAAFPDTIHNGKVADYERCQFIEEYTEQVMRARMEGVPVNGYFVWTLTDNFEWAEGYHPRFGLVHVDFDTQTRTIKQSGYAYSNLIRRYALGETSLAG